MSICGPRSTLVQDGRARCVLSRIGCGEIRHRGNVRIRITGRDREDRVVAPLRIAVTPGSELDREPLITAILVICGCREDQLRRRRLAYTFTPGLVV